MSKRKRFGLDERFANSKFDYCKNLKWFLIAPVAIIIIGVVLLCSVGFNLGIDFTGGSNMTIYIDEDGTYGDVHKLNDTKEIENIIQAVLDEKGKVDPVRLNALTFDQFKHGYYVSGEQVGKAWNAGAGLMKK